jgi:hypothetical protein
MIGKQWKANGYSKIEVKTIIYFPEQISGFVFLFEYLGQ